MKTMEKRAALLWALCASSLTACVSVNHTMLTPGAYYEPISPEEVEVFLAEEDVIGEFEKIAIVFSEGDADFNDRSDLIEAMRKRAAELGAHAIILGELADPSTSDRIVGEIFDTEANRRGEVVAIRFLN